MVPSSRNFIFGFAVGLPVDSVRSSGVFSFLQGSLFFSDRLFRSAALLKKEEISFSGSRWGDFIFLIELFSIPVLTD
ncbi:hypothetical protein LEP1GSC047_0045 [Leptospira inadai serovar Lyme str. 10]|uniref:Uncharacterized protein n=2 Tax=Leptospira inadai serovar Lyme TaxID=293084 RepID=V6HE31_9LEPT|nr:hypothetical protein LEP1GSC047_0045 [Leptospira inadai serovar Lyme str. 10]PNV74019.1 hypothetical protein BES34_015825 [Leptospira inadai serovar Lyme]